MENDILFKILQLDSLTGFLDWTERVMIHLYREEKTEALTLRTWNLYDWIVKKSWEAPKMKYCDDCLQYFYDPGSDKWIQVENYLKLHPEYKKDLNDFKNN